MSVNSPKIDDRNKEDLVDHLRELALHYCSPEWDSIKSIKDDKLADSLIHIFAWMMEIIIQRLNRAPDKNFLSFLDLIGVSLLPPGVAKAPLVFTMAAGVRQFGFIPAGTQVASAKTKEQAAVVFETEKDLTVILPGLVKGISLDPENDKWTDHSLNFFNKEETDIVKTEEALFTGENLVPHRLYLGDDELFSFEEPATITLDIELEKDIVLPDYLSDWKVEWYYYGGEPPEKRALLGFKLTDRSLKELEFKYQDIDETIINNLREKLKDQIYIDEKRFVDALKKAIGEENTENYKSSILEYASCAYGVEVDTEGNVKKDAQGNVIKNVDVVNLLKKGKIVFQDVSGISKKTLTGFEEETGPQKSWNSHWIFAELKTPLPPRAMTDVSTQKIELPRISSITANITINRDKLLPELAFFNNLPLDLTKDFYPFGEKPRFNDTFFIGSEEIFSKEGATITINIELSDSNEVLTPNTQNIKLSWEFWDGESWNLLGETSHDGVTQNNPSTYGFTDGTNAFKINGEKQITFTCPKIKKDKVRPLIDQESYWIRIRITGGNYGKEATYTSTPGNDGEVWVYQPHTFQPPSIKKFSIDYDFSYELPKRPQVILTFNGFWYHDHSRVKQLQVKPFQPVTDTEPALYLAFGQDISTLPVTLFFPLLENIFTLYQENQSQSQPIVAWQYWNGRNWVILSAEDHTRNFTRREMVQFLAPNDVIKGAFFGEEHYWIRAILVEEGRHMAPPRLQTIYTNTVWSRSMTTVNNEILGSSNGEPGQVFKFSKFPVLPGQAILVRETALTEEERVAIISEEGKDAVEENRDEAGNIIEMWVRWHEMDNFYFSEPNSRHYVMDRNSGTIIFGDAQRGKIPPAGKDNIKCGLYHYGGGVKGNVKAGTITQLRTTFPYIDSVINPVAAEGGSDQEDIDRVRIRGPQTIKHRDRAVTHEDFEWLVREASSKVAKVKCLSTTDTALQFSPGQVTLIIVPESEDPKPLPSQELISEIEEYLFARASTHLTTLNPSRINMIGPGYIRVGVEADVKYISISAAKIIEGRIIDNLKSFFHPLYGGPEKKGWDFGRNVYISEVYEVIENTEGVDYVDKLFLNASVQIYKLLLPEEGIIPPVSYPAQSCITADKEKIYLFCWDKIQSASGSSQDPAGSENDRLREFLRQDFGIDWAISADIVKNDYEINVNEINQNGSQGSNSLTLRLNNEETKIAVTIENGKTDEFKVIIKDGQRNVYGKMIFTLAEGLRGGEEVDSFTLVGFREGDQIILRDGAKSIPLFVKSVLRNDLDEDGNIILDKDSNKIKSIEFIMECETFETVYEDYEYPQGSIVETQDKRIRSCISDMVVANQAIISLRVEIFQAEDEVFLSHKDGSKGVGPITIDSISTDYPEVIFIDENYLIYSGTHVIKNVT